MRIAIPVLGDRVSTVFDAADDLVIIEYRPGSNPIRSRTPCLQNAMMARTTQFRALQIDILICGAIARSMKHRIEAIGIRVISFIRGSVDDVFDAFCRDELGERQFILPGCHPDHCLGKNRYRRRHGRSEV
jgi:predicted Fe-Mo cluster-binding NifX family protein